MPPSDSLQQREHEPPAVSAHINQKEDVQRGATRAVYPFGHKTPTAVEVYNPLTKWIFYFLFLSLILSDCKALLPTMTLSKQ